MGELVGVLVVLVGVVLLQVPGGGGRRRLAPLEHTCTDDHGAAGGDCDS
jgi:hypothetical protein